MQSVWECKTYKTKKEMLQLFPSTLAVLDLKIVLDSTTCGSGSPSVLEIRNLLYSHFESHLSHFESHRARVHQIFDAPRSSSCFDPVHSCPASCHWLHWHWYPSRTVLRSSRTNQQPNAAPVTQFFLFVLTNQPLEQPKVQTFRVSTKRFLRRSGDKLKNVGKKTSGEHCFP